MSGTGRGGGTTGGKLGTRTSTSSKNAKGSIPTKQSPYAQEPSRKQPPRAASNSKTKEVKEKVKKDEPKPITPVILLPNLKPLDSTVMQDAVNSFAAKRFQFRKAQKEMNEKKDEMEKLLLTMEAGINETKEEMRKLLITMGAGFVPLKEDELETLGLVLADSGFEQASTIIAEQTLPVKKKANPQKWAIMNSASTKALIVYYDFTEQWETWQQQQQPQKPGAPRPSIFQSTFIAFLENIQRQYMALLSTQVVPAGAGTS